MRIEPLALVKAVRQSASDLLLLSEQSSTTITGPCLSFRCFSSLFATVAQIASLKVPEGVRQRRFPNIRFEDVLQFVTGWHGMTFSANCIPASLLHGRIPTRDTF